MTDDARVTMHKGAALLMAVALLLVGAGASYLVTRRSEARRDRVPAAGTVSGTPPAAAPPPVAVSADAPLPDVVVPLSKEAAERSGIATAAVTSGASTTELRVPGVVQPNAYRQVAVTALVAGRVTRVSAELGERVRRNETMAQIYSPELAEAQTKYVAAQAMLAAHDRELQRTQKLIDIGAASRQELERLHAEHAAQTAAVQSARSQLELLGVPATTLDALASGKPVSATITVAAPRDGIVTERAANVGLNVDPGSKLFTVADLSTVWVVAEIYEKDFARVRVGSAATITTSAYPDLLVRGRVGYIDPQVTPETRTAKVRVEVPNPRGALRLGMYADVVVIGEAGRTALLIPRSAVQHVGDRTVVYLVRSTEPGTYTEREVRLADASGDHVEVTAGVRAGDVVVTTGSFFVRAERERLGLRPASAPAAEHRTPQPAADGRSRDATSPQTAQVLVTEQGFEPATIVVKAGAPVRITFLRTTDNTCATEIAIPSLAIKRPLPLKQPVEVALTPAKSGEIAFICGMNMLKGAIVVQ
ncbi:MAG TPA: efflux RND transporter periplasmic adaptor subunit [Vicinamibacterales bacterium]|nr:efflux RND transporter periplasmic adaptor subunit [Vicinamibacterales bacterium]